MTWKIDYLNATCISDSPRFFGPPVHTAVAQSDAFSGTTLGFQVLLNCVACFVVMCFAADVRGNEGNHFFLPGCLLSRFPCVGCLV